MARSGYELTYLFEYDGYGRERYFYDVPVEDACEAVRRFFSERMVEIDGGDSDLLSALNDISPDAFEEILDKEKDWLKAKCKDNAYEEFVGYVEQYLKEE